MKFAAFCVVFGISLFKAVSSTIEEIDRQFGLSIERKSLLGQKFRIFRIGSMIGFFCKLSGVFGIGFGSYMEQNVGNFVLASDFILMTLSVALVVFVCVLFRATQAESLDARATAAFNTNADFNSIDQENADF